MSCPVRKRCAFAAAHPLPGKGGKNRGERWGFSGDFGRFATGKVGETRGRSGPTRVSSGVCRRGEEPRCVKRPLLLPPAAERQGSGRGHRRRGNPGFWALGPGVGGRQPGSAGGPPPLSGYPRAGTWRGATPASSAAASLLNKGAIVFVLMPPLPPPPRGGGRFGATFPRAERGVWVGLC